MKQKPRELKTWMAWMILIVAVTGIILLSYWLSSTLSIETCIGITIVLNFIVSCYLAYEKYK